MKTVFLDTVGLIALWESADQWHAPAKVVFQRLLAEGVPLVTTPEILLECANTAARRTYRRDVVEFRDRLAKVGGIIVPTLDEVQNAWKAYADGIGANAGMVDQISFVVMRRLKLTQVFTNDRHFAACGFETLF